MHDPPWPYFFSSSVITSTAFSAVSALSSPSLENCRVRNVCFASSLSVSQKWFSGCYYISNNLFYRGFTWQDPYREELRRHLHSLCPTLLHFQYTLDVHLRPFLRPTAMLVCSTSLHKCGQPARSLCMYTVHKIKKRTTVNGYPMARSPKSSHCGQLWNWRLEGNNKLYVSPTSTFSPASKSLAGK